MKDNQKIASGLLVIALIIVTFILFITFFILIEESIFSNYLIQSTFNNKFLVTDLESSNKITASGEQKDPNSVWVINRTDIRIPLILRNNQGFASVTGEDLVLSSDFDAPFIFNWNVNNTFSISSPPLPGFLTVEDDGSCIFREVEMEEVDRQIFNLIEEF